MKRFKKLTMVLSITAFTLVSVNSLAQNGVPVDTNLQDSFIDVDGDGVLEVVIGSYDNKLYCLVGNGDPQAIPGPWPMRGGSALHHGNATDTDGDDMPDILEISLGLDPNDSGGIPGFPIVNTLLFIAVGVFILKMKLNHKRNRK